MAGKQKHASKMPKYALVRWVSGRETGQLSHEVPTAWISDFHVNADISSESWIIEWRVPPQPADGWPLYDGKVLAINDDLSILKLLREKEEQLEAALKNGSDSRVEKGSPTWSESTGPKTPTSSKNNADPNVHALLAQILAATQGSKTCPSPVQPRNSFNATPAAEDGYMKVGRALTITVNCYNEARAARTPENMTKVLIRGSFSTKRLKRSTYAGQKRGDVRKPSLKKYTKMEDIRNFVLSRFNVFSQSNFGQSVNNCTGKKAKSKKRVKLVEESEESADEEEEEGEESDS